MSARSVTIITEDDRELVRIYQESHGEPEDNGQLLACLCDVEMVNTYSNTATKQAHGIRCLAAQIVQALKDCHCTNTNTNGVGGVYIGPTYEPIPEWIDFTYIVRGRSAAEEQVTATILCTTQTGEFPFNPFDIGKCIYAGTPTRWIDWVNTLQTVLKDYEEEIKKFKEQEQHKVA
jgi:hypothetical protein